MLKKEVFDSQSTVITPRLVETKDECLFRECRYPILVPSSPLEDPFPIPMPSSPLARPSSLMQPPSPLVTLSTTTYSFLERLSPTVRQPKPSEHRAPNQTAQQHGVGERVRRIT